MKECEYPEPNVMVKSTRLWKEDNGVIYFSVTSDGRTGEDWLQEGFQIPHMGQDSDASILHSPDFMPTSGVTTQVAILSGSLFEGDNRFTKKIRAEAERRKLKKPNPEVACLIREKFTNKIIEAMVFDFIVVMHEPIIDSAGRRRLLECMIDVHGHGARRLIADIDEPEIRCEGDTCPADDPRYQDKWWSKRTGFAFAI